MLLVALQLAAMQPCIWASTLCKILRTSGFDTVLFWTAGLVCSVPLHFIPFCELVPTPSLSALQCVSTSYKGGAGYCKWWPYLENVGTAKVQTLFHCYHPSQPQVCFGCIQITIPSILTYSGPGVLWWCLYNQYMQFLYVIDASLVPRNLCRAYAQRTWEQG